MRRIVMSECAADRYGAKKPAGITPNGRHIQTEKGARNSYFCAHLILLAIRKLPDRHGNVKALNSGSIQTLV
jgi:hypothetical protein